MSLSVDSTAFLTLERVRREALDLGEGEDVDRDGVIVAMINRATFLAEEFTRRNLRIRSYSSVLHEGTGIEFMHLDEYPIPKSPPSGFVALSIKVDSVRAFTADPLIVWDESTNIGSAQVRVDYDTAELERLDGNVFPCGQGTVLATYTAGFQAGSREAEIIVAAQMLMIQDWWHRIGDDPRVKSESQAGRSQTLDCLCPIVTPAKHLLLAFQRPACLC